MRDNLSYIRPCLCFIADMISDTDVDEDAFGPFCSPHFRDESLPILPPPREAMLCLLHCTDNLPCNPLPCSTALVSPACFALPRTLPMPLTLYHRSPNTLPLTLPHKYITILPFPPLAHSAQSPSMVYTTLPIHWCAMCIAMVRNDSLGAYSKF